MDGTIDRADDVAGLCTRYLPLARRLAKRFSRRAPQWWHDEFESEAAFVLLAAARRWNPAVSRFEPHATALMYCRLISTWRAMKKSWRLPQCQMHDLFDAAGPVREPISDSDEAFEAMVGQLPPPPPDARLPDLPGRARSEGSRRGTRPLSAIVEPRAPGSARRATGDRGGTVMRDSPHDSRPLYELLIEPLRERARELGYALGVHGTLRYDIDLIACPWTEEAVPAHELAEALLLVAGRVNGTAFMTPAEGKDRYHLAGRPGNKPHGRLGWCFHLGSGPYIDLSVMPRTDPPRTTWIMRGDDSRFMDDMDGRQPPRWFGKIGMTQVFEHGKERHGDAPDRA